jgi:farnesyl-diphosphate farnesyltransferase
MSQPPPRPEPEETRPIDASPMNATPADTSRTIPVTLAVTSGGGGAPNPPGAANDGGSALQSRLDRTSADVDRLLLRTSRTFALAIPQLPEPIRREVGVAYLLFRIADTFEDATRWPRADRLRALAAFDGLLRATSGREAPRDEAWRLSATWVDARPCDHEGYLELLGAVPGVLGELDGMKPSRRAALIHYTLRTSEGMAGFVSAGSEEGNLRLGTLADLRHYCYIVAGIVGELLTDLFLDHAPGLAPVREALVARATCFGEGLQLVNILKDADSDARHGRVYLPPALERAEILALARADLDAAREYVLTLQDAGAPRGFVGFTALPVLLARATLDHIERFGAGRSISRAEVAALFTRLQADLDAGVPVIA